VRNIVSVDHIALSIDEISKVSGKFTYPDTITRSAGRQTPWIITIYIGIFIIPQSINFICFGLCDTGCRIDTVDKFARERFSMALPGREIIIVVIEADMKPRVVWRNARDIIQGCI
jgi:hypothetical protein